VGFIPAKSPGDTTSFVTALESGIGAIYAAPDKLIDFGMSTSIYLHEHPERAGSMDAAESAAIDADTEYPGNL